MRSKAACKPGALQARVARDLHCCMLPRRSCHRVGAAWWAGLSDETAAVVSAMGEVCDLAMGGDALARSLRPGSPAEGTAAKRRQRQSSNTTSSSRFPPPAPQTPDSPARCHHDSHRSNKGCRWPDRRRTQKSVCHAMARNWSITFPHLEH